MECFAKYAASTCTIITFSMPAPRTYAGEQRCEILGLCFVCVNAQLRFDLFAQFVY